MSDQQQVELARQAYLKEMGIDSYFPRWQQPGAPESVEILWRDFAASYQQQSAAGPNAEGTPSPSQPLAPPPSVESSQLKALVESAADAASDTQPATPAAPLAEQTLAPFVLRYWLADKVLFVEGTESEFPPGSERLLFNLSVALGRPLEKTFPDPFRWPLANMPGQKARQVSAARGAALASLQAVLKQKPFSHIVLLGGVSTQVLFDRDAEALRGQSFQQEGIDAALWCTYSLAELLANSLLKRETWRHLMALRRKA